MIANVSAHRRANAFAQAVESAVESTVEFTDARETGPSAAPEAARPPLRAARGGGTVRQVPAHPADAAHERMLALANALANLPAPQLDPAVKTVHRAQLIAAMEAALAAGTLDASGQVPGQRGPDSRGSHRAARLRSLRPRSRWSRRLAAGGLTVGVAAGAFSGVAAASTDALPGDSLYGLKRGMEDLRLGMAGDDADRGKVLLDMASIRFQEARRLMERSRSGPLDGESVREVRRALSGMHNEAAEGHQLLSDAYRRDGSLSSIEALDAFSQAHRQRWSRLRERLPAQLSDVGAQVSSVLEAIEQEVAPLQSLLPRSPGGSPNGRPGAGGDTGGGDQGGDRRASSPSGTAAHDRRRLTGRDGASPSVSDSLGTGPLGGSGLLTPPLGGGSQSPSTGKTGDGSGKPQPEVTLPPLLPGLLPGLGLNGSGGDTAAK